MRRCIQAWNDLGTERPAGMAGSGAIPFSRIVVWSRFRRLDRDATEILIAVINRLDCDRAEREASQRSLR